MPQLFRESCATKYYKVLKELFIQINYMEGKFLKDFRSVLREYVLEHPGCTYDDLVERFGDPTEIWYDYIGEQEPDYLLRCVKKKYVARWIKVCIVVVCICCCFVWGFFYYRLYESGKSAIIDEHVVIIEEGD